MARGSFILLSRELVAGTAFMVLDITSGLGLNVPRPPGSTILGGVRGVGGRILRVSMMFTGFRSGSLCGKSIKQVRTYIRMVVWESEKW